MNSLRTIPSCRRRQRGVALMVMLVIMIMGVTLYLVSALSKVTLQTARNEKSANLLAQAKEVIIGYAITGTGGARPGDLMRPDVLSPSDTPIYNYDGVSEGGCLDASKTGSSPTPGLPLILSGTNLRCLGRLPWKSYKMPIPAPTDNDSTGIMPWYAVSANLADPGCVTVASPGCAYNTHPYGLNSEILNAAPPPYPWLTVRDMNGNVLSNRVAFVLIIPGPSIAGQSRTPYPNLGGASQYLDSITVPAGCAVPCIPGTYRNADMDNDFIMGDEHRWIDDPANPGKQIDDPTYNFNDKLLYVTIDELMPLIEKRIAREVKSCLDDYASAAGNTSNRYPWAVPVTDAAVFPNRSGAYDTRFGRIPEIPNTSTTSGGTPPTGTLLTYILAVQAAMNAYVGGTGSLGALKTAGDILKDFAPPSSPAQAAGITADNCTGMSCISTLTSQLNTALGNGTPDPTMPGTWTTAACTSLFTSSSSYWAEWRDLVFYQIAEGYRPGGGTFAPLQIGGSGNTNGGNGTYRAAVIVAGKALGTQSRANPAANPPNGYLANNTSEQSADPAFVTNAHDSAGSTTSFITYKVSDPYYQNVNDLVLCLDGKNNCK